MTPGARFPHHLASMDILVSSNLERLLYHAAGDAAKVRGWMESLASTGRYEVDPAVMERIRAEFAAGCADNAPRQARTQFEGRDTCAIPTPQWL